MTDTSLLEPPALDELVVTEPAEAAARVPTVTWVAVGVATLLVPFVAPRLASPEAAMVATVAVAVAVCGWLAYTISPHPLERLAVWPVAATVVLGIPTAVLFIERQVVALSNRLSLMMNEAGIARQTLDASGGAYTGWLTAAAAAVTLTGAVVAGVALTGAGLRERRLRPTDAADA